MPAETPQAPVSAAWSQPINGLSARLRVEFEDLSPGLRHAVYLELGNHSSDPIAVTNQPQIRAELLDSSGMAVGTSNAWISGPIPSPQWAVIPRDAYIGFRIDMQTVGVPTREHGTVLLAVGGKMWGLRPGEYVLRATLVGDFAEGGPREQWIGELPLQPLKVVVTPQMLALG
jgi:hypothetical protein